MLEKTYPCVLDEKQRISKHKWAVTLITDSGGTSLFLGKHVQILCEGCNDQGKYFAEIYHLTGSSYIPIINIWSQLGETVKCSDLTKKVKKCGKKAIRYISKTPTFVVEKRDAELMIERIEATKKSSTFNLLGRHSVFTTPYRYTGFMQDNCFTWAIDKTYYAGIKFPSYISDWVLYSDPQDDITEHAKKLTYNMGDLCKLAKSGANEVIKRQFHGVTHVNQLVYFAHPEGPVEFFLGYYTPLALAVAYDHFDTVKLLCEYYKAEINVLNGRNKNYTALDCAHINWWGANKNSFFSARPSERIKRYLIEHGGVTCCALESDEKKFRIEKARNDTVFKAR